MIACEDQKEVDRFWEKLLDGGKPTACGWLKDKFGVSWQVVPNDLPKYLGERDPAKSARIMKSFFAMQKIDLAELERARAG
jgi:predicted 3-demethylubiquinone-9 3-methyltransferase (glyoxalase superfamily)